MEGGEEFFGGYFHGGGLGVREDEACHVYMRGVWC